MGKRGRQKQCVCIRLGSTLDAACLCNAYILVLYIYCGNLSQNILMYQRVAPKRNKHLVVSPGAVDFCSACYPKSKSSRKVECVTGPPKGYTTHIKGSIQSISCRTWGMIQDFISRACSVSQSVAASINQLFSGGVHQQTQLSGN